MINGCATEKVDGKWRIVRILPTPDAYSIETFPSQEDAIKALKEGNYSFY